MEESLTQGHRARQAISDLLGQLDMVELEELAAEIQRRLRNIPPKKASAFGEAPNGRYVASRQPSSLPAVARSGPPRPLERQAA